MTESHPIPALAKTAHALIVNEYQRVLNSVGEQTVEALGLKQDGGWTVNFNTGVVSRDLPDTEDSLAPRGDVPTA